MLSACFPVRQMRARPLACIGVAFLLGMLLCTILPFSPLWLLIGCIPLFALRKRSSLFPTCAVLLLTFVLGALRLDAALSVKPQVSTLTDTQLTGVITDDPLYREDGRIVCSLKVTAPISCKVKLYLRSDTLPLEGIAYGQEVLLTGSLWEGDLPTNPHQSNARYALLASGYDGRMTATLENTEIIGMRHSLWDIPHNVRAFLSSRIDALFPKSSALAKAFILGDRSELSEDVREDFTNSGIAHLICISGMHISVLSSALLWLLSRRLPARYAAPITVVCVFLYGALIGFPVSFIRAFIMFTVLSFAPLCGRAADSITRLMLAMSIMLLIEPLWIFHTGFALSFAASGGIMLCVPPLEDLFHVQALPKKNRLLALLQKVLSLLCVTFAAQMATLPIVLACYGAQSPLSVAANLLAVPLAMFAYPIALATVLLSIPLHALALLIAPLADNLFYPLQMLAHLFSGLGGLKLRLPVYPLFLTLLHFTLLIAASPLSALSEKLRRFLLPLGVGGCALLSIGFALIQATPFNLTFLDGGQADATLLQLCGKTYCIDVGDAYSPVLDVVAAAQTVDAVFLTHPHDDHAGALANLLTRISPGAIYVPEGWFEDTDMSEAVAQAITAAEKSGIPVLPLTVGDTFELPGDLTIRVESVGQAAKRSENSLFLLLRIEYHGKSFLFTGDMSARDEPAVLADCDVLKVAHHGAKTSTSEEFLAQTRPEIAVISVGQNSYGHPHPDVLARLEDVGCEVYRTDKDGAVRLTLDRSNRICVKPYNKRKEG